MASAALSERVDVLSIMKARAIVLTEELPTQYRSTRSRLLRLSVDAMCAMFLGRSMASVGKP